MHINTPFVRIDEYPGYLVYKDGSVYSERRKRFLRPSLNNKGYLNVRLKNRKGKTVTIGIHRLLCFCFKPIPDFHSRLVVNHLDGIKINNDLPNLEWTTYKKNLVHAGMMKLTTKCKPVVLIRLDTWETTHYDSVVDCARALDISKDRVSLRVNQKTRRYPGENFVIIYQSELESFLNEVDKDAPDFDQGGTKKPVYLKILETEEILFFDKLTSLAEYLNVPLPTISTWMKIEGQPVLPGLIQIKKQSDTSPWREVKDMYLDLMKNFSVKPVIVVSEKNDNKVFVSGIDCAKAMGLTPTALSYRLKSNGSKVFSDGYRYAYYSTAVQNGLVSSK